MSKKILFGDIAREELIKGADYIGEAVKTTLGPFGGNFFLEKGDKVTNDGVSVAREIECEDEIQNKGAREIFKASNKTNLEVGDGTTTAVILAQSILKEASRLLGSKSKGIFGKKTPVEIINQINKEKDEVIAKLKEMSKPVDTKEKLIDSAKVSVEYDDLGELIGGMQWELGKNGKIIAEEVNKRESSIDKVPGLRIDNGFVASHLINNPEKQTFEVTECRTLLTNYTIKDYKQIEKIAEQLFRAGITKLVIIAGGFTSEFIKFCVENINTGGMHFYPLNAPFTDQADAMKDLQAILGGKFYHYESADLDSMVVDDIGYVEKITAQRFKADIVGKKDINSERRIAKRVEDLKLRLAECGSDFERTMLGDRIAQLEGGFALLSIGANSETERKHRKDKADDACNAVRHALRDGVVDGAGLAFKQISDSLPDTCILKRPLLSIYEQIKFSAPKDWEVPVWVKDPVAVLVSALNNACSIAGTFATASGVIVTAKPKPRLVEEIKQQTNEEE